MEKNWVSFKGVIENFLENNLDSKYESIVYKVLKNFEKKKCSTRLKVHFLKSHLDYFPENVGAYSEEMFSSRLPSERAILPRTMG